MAATPGLSLRDHGLPSALGRERLHLTLPATPVRFLPITPAYPYQRGGLYTLPLPPSRPSPRSSIRPPETALSWPATATSRTQRPRPRLPSPRASPTDSFIHRHTQEAAGDPAKRRTRHTPGPHGAALLPPALRPGAADAAAASSDTASRVPIESSLKTHSPTDTLSPGSLETGAAVRPRPGHSGQERRPANTHRDR